MMGKRTDDPVTARIMSKVAAYRVATGQSRNEAADRADMDRTWWSHVESGGRSTTLRVADRMAQAVGLRLTVIPIDQGTPPPPERKPVPVPVAEPEPVAEVLRMPSPIMLRFMARIKAHREAMGLTHAQAGARAGWAKSTFGNLERGHGVGREVSADRIAAAAEAVGLSLELVAEHHRPLLELDPDEVEAVRRVVAWYRSQAPRLPVVLSSAADKLAA